MIKVRALELGYYGHKRRRVGDIFEISVKREFSYKWMAVLTSHGKSIGFENMEEFNKKIGNILKEKPLARTYSENLQDEKPVESDKIDVNIDVI